MDESPPTKAGDSGLIWSGKIPHPPEQLSLSATTTEPVCLEPVLHRKRSHCDGKPRHHNRVAATRETQQGRPSATINKYVTNRHAKSLQSCLTLCNPMDCSPPGPSVHDILLARILENFWVAMPFSRGFGRQVLYHWRHLGSSITHTHTHRHTDTHRHRHTHTHTEFVLQEIHFGKHC